MESSFQTDGVVHDGDMPDFYTPDEVAEKLSVDVRTIYRWLRDGKLPGVKLAGNIWRIRISDYEAFTAPKGQQGEPK